LTSWHSTQNCEGNLAEVRMDIRILSSGAGSPGAVGASLVSLR